MIPTIIIHHRTANVKDFFIRFVCIFLPCYITKWNIIPLFYAQKNILSIFSDTMESRGDNSLATRNRKMVWAARNIN